MVKQAPLLMLLACSVWRVALAADPAPAPPAANAVPAAAPANGAPAPAIEHLHKEGVVHRDIAARNAAAAPAAGSKPCGVPDKAKATAPASGTRDAAAKPSCGSPR